MAAMLLSAAAGPALASNDATGARAATTDLAAGTTALERDTVDVEQLTERVVGLERRVDQLGEPAPSPVSTAAELDRAKREEQQQAEFQRQVWTMP